MIKYLRILRNKFIVTFIVFSIYMLFLDDVDVFTIIRQRAKYNKLLQEKELVYEKYTKTKSTLDELNTLEALEKFAREEKIFKKDDEDIFIIVE